MKNIVHRRRKSDDWYDTIHTVEEKLNSFTHGVGAGLSIAGLIILILMARRGGGSGFHYLSFSLYGAFQILLYVSSALTHQFADMPRVNKVLRILDQASVYLLIAGTYTPIAFLVLQGVWRWIIFDTIWGLALAGILSKVLFFREKNIISDLFYLPMGWLIAVAYKPLLLALPEGLGLWIIIGGLSYTVGVVFYLVKKIPFSHVIWHLFVLAGGISFYLGFAFYLT